LPTTTSTTNRLIRCDYRGDKCNVAVLPLIKPNSITLAGSKLVRRWLELIFGLSSSLLAAN